MKFLRFEQDLSATDLASRTIEGTILPFGETGLIAGVRYRFAPGSLKRASRRVPLLVDHDRTAPVGVLAELTEGDAGVMARFSVDTTPAGDTALVQAASGSRGALSVGAEVEESAPTDGVIEVREARLVEVSLATLGAFESAEVHRVAASATEEPAAEPEEPAPEPEPDPNQEELPVEEEPEAPAPPADTDPEGGTMQVEASSAAPVVLAERSRSARELTAGQYVQALIAAQSGDREAGRLIEAALTETVSTDIAGLLPPAYETTVLGPAPIDRVLYNTFRGRPLPGVGLTIQKPTWTTFPNGAWAANVDADATTGKAVIGLNPATILRWDWATAISYTAAKRSSPDAISTIYAAAVEDFYKDVEVSIANLLIATAGVANAAVKLGAGISAFYTVSGRAPEVIVVSPDVWGALADSGAITPPIGMGSSSVSAGEGGLRSSYAGISIVASGALPATTKLLATRRALDVRISEPVQLTANAIGALNVELGVVGEGLFDADYATEVMLLTAGAPVFMTAEQQSAFDKETKAASR